MRTPRVQLALVLAALVALVVLPSAPAPAADGLEWELDGAGGTTIAPGVVFKRARWELNGNVSRPLILEIAPFGNAATIDVAAAGTKLLMSAKVSKMATDHNAYGAINGDFGIKRPDHVFIEDGKMWGSGLQNGGTIFGFRGDEASGYIGAPKTRLSYKVNTPEGAKIVDVKRWNAGKPGAGEIVAYSPEGGNPEKPPINACSVLLTAPGNHVWTSQQKLISRSYTVNKRKCSETTAMAAPTGNQIVLSAKRRGAGKKALGALTIGGTISLRWGTAAAGSIDVVGGRQHMVANGEPNETTCDPNVGDDLCDPNPRAGVGINQACETGPAEDCRVYYVVVDGRQGTSWSQGLSLANFAKFLDEQLGVTEAVNLDGGGSATMWVKKGNLPAGACQNVSGAVTTTGCVVNRPSTNGSDIIERGSENAILVKPSPDTFPAAEPVGLT